MALQPRRHLLQLWSGPAGEPVPSPVRMKAPNSAMPALSAPACPRTVPVTAGLAFAQVRAARALVKKLMYPQVRSAA